MGSVLYEQRLGSSVTQTATGGVLLSLTSYMTLTIPLPCDFHDLI